MNMVYFLIPNTHIKQYNLKLKLINNKNLNYYFHLIKMLDYKIFMNK